MKPISFAEYSAKRSQGLVRRFAPKGACILDQLVIVQCHDHSHVVFATRKEGRFCNVPVFDFVPEVPLERALESFCFERFKGLDERFWHLFGLEGTFAMEVFTNGTGELWSKVCLHPVRVVPPAPSPEAPLAGPEEQAGGERLKEQTWEIYIARN